MKFISLSQYPGRTGEYYYNNMFKLMNIDAEYTAQASSNIKESIQQAQKQGVNGISISMPFKQQVIPLLNHQTANVEIYNSCNTIVNKDNFLTGYNADLAGVEHVTKSILRSEKINILGSGAIASMFVKYLEGSEYHNLNLYSRTTMNWQFRNNPADVIINCTALGTSTADSPFEQGQLNPKTRLVIDMAIKENTLKQQCQDLGIKYVTGSEFYRHQFMTQFYIYTGKKVEAALYETLEKQYESI
jgi:shikimate dehydrogenase